MNDDIHPYDPADRADWMARAMVSEAAASELREERDIATRELAECVVQNFELRDALDRIADEPEDPLKVQEIARHALARPPLLEVNVYDLREAARVLIGAYMAQPMDAWTLDAEVNALEKAAGLSHQEGS